MESKETSSDAEVYVESARDSYTSRFIQGKMSSPFLMSFKSPCVHYFLRRALTIGSCEKVTFYPLEAVWLDCTERWIREKIEKCWREK